MENQIPNFYTNCWKTVLDYLLQPAFSVHLFQFLYTELYITYDKK